MKKFTSIFALICMATSLFAFQIRSSGRDAIQNSLKNGEIPTQVGIRSDLYLDDFAFPYKNRTGEAVSVFVQQEKSLAYLNGDENSVQVAIKTNSSEFFPQRDVNYVIFVTNPAFVQTEKGRAVFSDSVTQILAEKSENSKIYFYIPENEKVALVSNEEELSTVLDELALSEKSNDIAGSLETIANLSSEPSNVLPWEVLCVSEQDMFKNSFDEQSFFQLPFAHKNISFAYVGYGIQSDWKQVTEKAEKLDVSLYYENTYKSLTNRIVSDFSKFSHYKLENLEVRIVYAPDVKMNPRNFKLGNLGIEESHIILEKVAVPSFFALKKDVEIAPDFPFNYVNVSVKYELPVLDENGNLTKNVFYKVYPLSIQYSENPTDIEGSRNAIVEKNAILKNSSLVYFQVERLIDMGFKNQSLSLIENQITDLEKIFATYPDRQIEVEINNFKMLKELVLGKNE